jgi:hypothetical protein
VEAESLDSWKPVNDDSATPYVKLLAWWIAKLTQGGLKGIDTINCWISWQIQPLQYRDHLMHQYTGSKDGIHCSEVELDPEIIEKRCSALPFEKGRTPVLSATPWITDSTTVQNIVIIAILSRLQRKSSYISLQPNNTQQKA